MVSLTSLWLPILLSAAVVFMASSFIHMALKYHSADFKALPDEDGVMSALRNFGLPAGDYAAPRATDMKEMSSEAHQEKLRKGPAFFMTVIPPEAAGSMGRALVMWFLFTAVVSVFAGYLAGRTLTAGTDYLMVFRITGTVAFAAYGVGGWQRAVWFHQPLGTTLRNTFDGLIYALLTAGVFGWLWP
ncbi:MAG: hypothetical protein OEZ65_05610 [Gemmatimonadota bacterium]|nr:hypothetical protein [Gemmatimonadota bacterium]MDH5759047.1 hypothetical protein [Gemmatimonadota bacterium]